jgi:2-keto-4-pentenoate hydratase/2-oxohepta-3-ene-1,7-dioic acid hydratase in catechol pathway
VLEANLTGQRWALHEVELLPSIEGPSEVYCVGLNYLDHQDEAAADLVAALPEDPIIFTKSLRAIAGPQSELSLPRDISDEFDWEVELGVVIGAPGRRISADRAMDHVAGYCVVNDVTARDLQKRHAQWHLGKNILQSTPIGPWVTAAVDSYEPHLRLQLSINGVEKQNSFTSEMLFKIPELIALLSTVCDLRPGDVIATGTPSGVGFKRTPPEYLQDGDWVEARIETLGTLSNMVHTSSAGFGDSTTHDLVSTHP